MRPQRALGSKNLQGPKNEDDLNNVSKYGTKPERRLRQVYSMEFNPYFRP